MNEDWKTRHPGRPAAYAALYPTLRDLGISMGYAVAIHGSMTHDLDLVAVPWVETADTPANLVHRVALAVDGDILEHKGKAPAIRPHGRLTWTIMLDGGMYIDLSVIRPVAEYVSIHAIKDGTRRSCEFEAEAETPTGRAIRERNFGHTKCRNSASYLFNGVPACARHAQVAALRTLTGEDPSK